MCQTKQGTLGSIITNDVSVEVSVQDIGATGRLGIGTTTCLARVQWGEVGELLNKGVDAPASRGGLCAIEKNWVKHTRSTAGLRRRQLAGLVAQTQLGQRGSRNNGIRADATAVAVGISETMAVMLASEPLTIHC